MGIEGIVVDNIKAWLTFDGTGVPSIYDSFNVLSIVDGGVGTYTVNFINPISNVNYAVLGTAGIKDSIASRILAAHSRTVSSVVINTYLGTGLNDINFNSVAIVTE